MNKKYIFPAILVVLAATLVAFYIYWQKYQENNLTSADTTLVNLNVNPGTLNQTVESDSTTTAEIQMSTVDVYFAPPAGATSTGNLTTTIKDHRGTAVGWSQTASCTDFASGANVIPVSNLTLDPQTISPIGNSSAIGVALGATHTFSGPADIATIIQAGPGNGTGRFQSDSVLQLLVPKTTPIGNYNATMTITII